MGSYIVHVSNGLGGRSEKGFHSVHVTSGLNGRSKKGFHSVHERNLNMAKIGLDYFYFPCENTEAMELLEAEFGLKAGAVIVKLYQKIFKQFGYYCVWDSEVQLLFSRKECNLPLGDNCVSEIVNTALKRGIFDMDTYQKYGILTSKYIQEKYFEAVKRRDRVEVENDYLLLKVDQIPKNVYIISKNVNKNEKNVYENQQSKVKKSKVNKSKEICGEPEQAASPPVIGLPLNDSTEHPIYQSDIEEWENLYPSVDVIQEIRKMRGWLLSNPERRKTKRGINRFINNWLSREQDKGHGVKATASKGTNKFTNYSQRQYDYKDIERMAAERLKNATI